MSVYGEWVAATISAGATKTSAIDLGRDYDYVSIQIPYVSNACKLNIEIAERTGGTYYELAEEDPNIEAENWGNADVWRLGGYRFIKLVSTAGQDSDWLIRVRGMRY